MYAHTNLVKCDKWFWMDSYDGQTGSVGVKQFSKHPDEHTSNFLVLKTTKSPIIILVIKKALFPLI